MKKTNVTNTVNCPIHQNKKLVFICLNKECKSRILCELCKKDHLLDHTQDIFNVNILYN